MIDKKITLVPGESGLGDIDFGTGDSLYNNIWLSLMTRRGTRFDDPVFGSRLYELTRRGGRLTAAALVNAEMWSREALQWLVDAGRVVDVIVKAEQDAAVFTRINLTVLLTKSGNKAITYNLWYDVV